MSLSSYTTAAPTHDPGKEKKADSFNGRSNKIRQALQVDLVTTKILMDYVLSCHLMRHCDEIIMDNLFLHSDFHITVGEQGLELEYINSTAFKQAITVVLAEAAMYLRVFGIVVFRIYRDQTSHLLNQILARMPLPTTLMGTTTLASKAKTSDQGLEGLRHAPTSFTDTNEVRLPIFVEHLDPKNGALFHVTNNRGERSWVYEPANEEDMELFTYQVFVNPVRSFVYPIKQSELIGGLDENVRPIVLASMEALNRANKKNITRGSDMYALRSSFWTGYTRYHQLRETMMNKMDADHILAHPRLIYMARPTKDIAADLVGADILQHAQSVPEAVALEQERVRRLKQQSFSAGAMYATRSLAGGLRERTAYESTSKRQTMRDMYGRPDAEDDIIELDENYQNVIQTPPTYSFKYEEEWMGYANTVCQLFGSVTIQDLLNMGTSSTSTSGKTPSAGGVGSKFSPSDRDAVSARRETMTAQQRQFYDNIFKWIYRTVFGEIDLNVLNQQLEAYDDVQQYIIERTLSQTGVRKPLSLADRRRVLYEVLRGTATRTVASRIVESHMFRRQRLSSKNTRRASDSSSSDSSGSSSDEGDDEDKMLVPSKEGGNAELSKKLDDILNGSITSASFGALDTDHTTRRSQHVQGSPLTVDKGEHDEKGGKEKKQDDTAEERRKKSDREQIPRIGDLRLLLIEKLNTRNYLEPTIVFEAEMQAEIQRSKLRDHEWLDPLTHQSRIKELELLGQLAANGIIHPDSVIRAAKELLNLDCKKAPTGSVVLGGGTAAAGEKAKADFAPPPPPAPSSLPHKAPSKAKSDEENGSKPKKPDAPSSPPKKDAPSSAEKSKSDDEKSDAKKKGDREKEEKNSGRGQKRARDSDADEKNDVQTKKPKTDRT